MEHLKLSEHSASLAQSPPKGNSDYTLASASNALFPGINRINNCVKRFPLPARFHQARHTFASPQQILTLAKPPSTPVAGKQRKYLNRHSPPKKQPRKIERKNNRLKTKSRTAKTDNRSTNVNLAFRRDIAHHHILIFSHTHIPPPFSTHRKYFAHRRPALFHIHRRRFTISHTPLLLHSPPKGPPRRSHPLTIPKGMRDGQLIGILQFVPKTDPARDHRHRHTRRL